MVRTRGSDVISTDNKPLDKRSRIISRLKSALSFGSEDKLETAASYGGNGDSVVLLEKGAF